MERWLWQPAVPRATAGVGREGAASAVRPEAALRRRDGRVAPWRKAAVPADAVPTSSPASDDESARRAAPDFCGGRSLGHGRALRRGPGGSRTLAPEGPVAAPAADELRIAPRAADAVDAALRGEYRTRFPCSRALQPGPTEIEIDKRLQHEQNECVSGSVNVRE